MGLCGEFDGCYAEYWAGLSSGDPNWVIEYYMEIIACSGISATN